MSHEHAFAISAAGMSLERARVEAAAANLAHANAAQGPDSAYQPRRVVARSFGALVEGALPSPVAELEKSGPVNRKVLDRGHPWADAEGFVEYPDVDTATEMVTLMSATRAYEANLAALQTTRQLALKALEIGRGA